MDEKKTELWQDFKELQYVIDAKKQLNEQTNYKLHCLEKWVTLGKLHKYVIHKKCRIVEKYDNSFK